MSPAFNKTGSKRWISMSLYDTLWHFMRCFEYKHSSSPLTAKEEKAGHTPGFFISGKCKAWFSTQTGIKKSYAQHKAFSSLKHPHSGERQVKRGNPITSIIRTHIIKYHSPDVRKMVETYNWIGITNRYLPHGRWAFSSLKHPPLGERLAQRGNPPFFLKTSPQVWVGQTSI